MRALAVVVVVFVAACPGKAPPQPVDAALLMDQAFGSACTVVTDTSVECTTGVCTDSINQLGIVCSQKCTLLNMTDPACPNGTMGTKCNQKGYCRP